MRNLSTSILVLVILSSIFAACKRNDEEPTLPPTRISRLYVSFSDIQEDDLEEPFKNIAIFDPANETQLQEPEWFASAVIGGSGITFDPFVSRVFQGSQIDSTVKSFSVNAMGVLGSGSSFKDTTLSAQQALVFDHVSTNLYVSNNATNSIHVYEKATIRNGRTNPNKRFMLSGQPRGLALSNDSLIVAIKAGSINRVVLLEHPSKIDSGVVSTVKTITIPEAKDLRGIAYSEKLDILAISDVGSGKVYIIEHARDAFTENKSVIPTRAIGGMATGMKEPIDVAIDDREEMYLYVADKGINNKKILRFKLSDDGDVAPETSYSFKGNAASTPASIYLDAR